MTLEEKRKLTRMIRNHVGAPVHIMVEIAMKKGHVSGDPRAIEISILAIISALVTDGKLMLRKETE